MKHKYYSWTVLLLLMVLHPLNALSIGPQSDGASGERNLSQIPWDKLKGQQWLNLREWLNIQEKGPNTAMAEKFRTRKTELMGRVMEFVGTSYLYRGLGRHQLSFLSKIEEGDEVETDGESYLWVYLLDGTLLRLSPHTSVSFKEFNLSTDKILLHVRINFGHVLWHSRLPHIYKEEAEFETDPLFFPLKLWTANPDENRASIENPLQAAARPETQGLLNRLLKSRDTKPQFKRLNTWILKNEEAKETKRPTEAWVVLPHGTLVGEDMVLDLFVRPMGRANFYQRDLSFSLAEGHGAGPIRAYVRGHKNLEAQTPKSETWYEFSSDGREMNRMAIEGKGVSYMKGLNFAQHMTRRIPSLLLARELMWDRYSKPFFEKNIDKAILLRRTGHRLWSPRELHLRGDYLEKMTRRQESELRGEAPKKLMTPETQFDRKDDFSEEYYQRAYGAFMKYASQGPNATQFFGAKESSQLHTLEERARARELDFKRWRLQHGRNGF